MSILRKRLYRSREDRMMTGLIGGAAEYLGGIDPTILRLAFVFLTVITGFVPGIAVYVVGVAIVPEKPRRATQSAGEPQHTTEQPSPETERVA